MKKCCEVSFTTQERQRVYHHSTHPTAPLACTSLSVTLQSFISDTTSGLARIEEHCQKRVPLLVQERVRLKRAVASADDVALTDVEHGVRVMLEQRPRVDTMLATVDQCMVMLQQQQQRAGASNRPESAEELGGVGVTSPGSSNTSSPSLRRLFGKRSQ